MAVFMDNRQSINERARVNVLAYLQARCYVLLYTYGRLFNDAFFAYNSFTLLHYPFCGARIFADRRQYTIGRANVVVSR